MEITNKDIVIILGGNILNGGIIDYCKSKNYFVIIVDWSPKAFYKGDLFLCIDVKDTKSIIKALEENGITNILGVYTSIDLAVPSLNAINQYYGLESMSQDGLNNALSKANMASTWSQFGLLNRYSGVFLELPDSIIELSNSTSIIIKPNISSSSRGITILKKNSDFIQIDEAFRRAQKESFDNKVIVEEFVEGQEFTCEMIGDKYGNVSVYAISVKYHTSNTKDNKIAIKLHYNSNYYPDAVYEKIAKFGKQCYKSLGFSSSFGHLELIMKSDGTFSPIEIGARSSGYITNPLVSLASNQDFLGDFFNILHGNAISGQDYINGHISSMYFFYDMPKNSTVLKSCNITEFLPNIISSRYHNRSKIESVGAQFEEIMNDNERVGFEILYGPRAQMSIENIVAAEKEFILNNTGVVI